MKDELTNKKLLFMTYANTNYLYKNEWGIFEGSLTGDTYHFDKHIKSAWLPLTSLNKITDEDAVEVVDIVKSIGIGSSAMCEPQKFLQPMKEGKGTIHIIAPVIDFLRSKGYAVPYLSWSVEQMIEAGWIKLR